MGKCVLHSKLSICKRSLGTEPFSKFARTVPCKGLALLILFHRAGPCSQKKGYLEVLRPITDETHTHTICQNMQSQIKKTRLQTRDCDQWGQAHSLSSLRLFRLWQRCHGTAGSPTTPQYKTETSRVLEMFLKNPREYNMLSPTIWEPVYMFNLYHLWKG